MGRKKKKKRMSIDSKVDKKIMNKGGEEKERSRNGGERETKIKMQINQKITCMAYGILKSITCTMLKNKDELKVFGWLRK